MQVGESSGSCFISASLPQTVQKAPPTNVARENLMLNTFDTRRCTYSRCLDKNLYTKSLHNDEWLPSDKKETSLAQTRLFSCGGAFCKMHQGNEELDKASGGSQTGARQQSDTCEKDEPISTFKFAPGERKWFKGKKIAPGGTQPQGGGRSCHKKREKSRGEKRPGW